MAMTQKWKPLLTAGVLFLAGCTTSSQNTSVVQNENANVTLAQAASTISDSLTQADAVQRATASPLALKKLVNLDNDSQTYGMASLASIDWSGPIGPVVKSIAQAANYKLRILGRPTALPVLISINVNNQPLGDILRDIDYQAGSKANIVVYPDNQLIELRYGRS